MRSPSKGDHVEEVQCVSFYHAGPLELVFIQFVQALLLY